MRTIALGIVLLLGVVQGCASVPDTPGPARDTTPKPMVPGRNTPQQLWLAVASPTDANSNGYADTFQVIVYLFPDREISAIPVWADGRFDFVLQTPSGEAINRWVFGNEATRQSRQRLAPGPGHAFFLRLPEGLDVREPVVASLRASFTPANDAPQLTGNGDVSVRLGSR